MNRSFGDTDTKRVLMAVGAAVGAALAGFVLYKLFSSTSEEIEDQDVKQLREAVEKIGKVRLNAQGVIPFEAFLEIFKVIRSSARSKLDSVLQIHQVERREKLKNNQMEEYRQIVLNQTKLEEQIYMDISNQVMAQLGLTEDDFQKTQQIHLTQPQHQARFFQAIQSDPKAKQAGAGSQAKVNYTREQAIEMFKFAEKLKVESMLDLHRQTQDPYSAINKDQVEYTNEMIVQQSIMADKLFLEFGVDETEFNRAVAQHQLYRDPEVQKMIQENMQNMPPEIMESMMMQMMGQTGMTNSGLSNSLDGQPIN